MTKVSISREQIIAALPESITVEGEIVSEETKSVPDESQNQENTAGSDSANSETAAQ